MTFETRICTQAPGLLVARGDGPQLIEGLASVFYREGDANTEFVLWRSAKGEAEAVERITPEAFDAALKRKDDVLATFQHDRATALARYPGTLELWTDSTGLKYRFEVDGTDPDHQRLSAKLRRGDVRGSSFAFVPDKVEWKRSDGGPRVCYVRSLQLRDVAVVTDPAYRATVAYARSSSEHAERRAKLAAMLSTL